MAAPRPQGGVRLSAALDSMQLAYNPITKQLHFVSPKPETPADDAPDDLDTLSKKSSFSDEGNFSISTCEKSDTSDSPKSTLNWGGSVSGHQRGKDGGSFSSTVSSLSECSLGSNASKEDEVGEVALDQEDAKLKKKGLSGFFSRGVFPWKSSSSGKSESRSETRSPPGAGGWRLFGRGGPAAPEPAPAPSAPATPLHHHHRRQGSSASDKQFEDLVASSIALIQHERPSNLPAKEPEEALRHRAEHLRMVEAARRRVERAAAARLARLQESLRAEERLARHAREWTCNVLPDWPAQRNAKRTQELWWSGLPPAVRGRVWQLAIGNRLGLTDDQYRRHAAQARRRLADARQRRRRLKLDRDRCACRDRDEERPGLPRNRSEQNLSSGAPAPALAPHRCCSASAGALAAGADESALELIELDVARTFPALCIFQPGAPYSAALLELLAAYACYRPDVGYIQGMSFIAAMLILNMEAPAAFVCFANLLETPVLRAAFTRDGAAMQRLWRAYSRLLAHNLPRLAGALAPELYLLEWLYTAFAKAMPLDAACRVWDVFLRDGDAFLFNTALGILHLYSERLATLDFIAAAQFLTKLPEELDAEALFRSIAAVSMSVEGRGFEQLVADEAGGGKGLDDDAAAL